MSLPLSRAKQVQNQAFLAALAMSGNVRDAARIAAVSKSVKRCQTKIPNKH